MTTRINDRTEQFTGMMFGEEVTVPISKTWVAYALVALRLAMGWIFLQAGVTKLLQPGWTAAGYLQNAVPEGNPFGSLWQNMAGAPFIDALNIWGPIFIGIGLILGLLVRWSAFWGAVMMLFYWAAGLHGGLLEGLPLEHGWIIDQHIVYVVLLFGLGAFGAGRILGLDRRIEQSEFVQRNPWLKYLLG